MNTTTLRGFFWQFLSNLLPVFSSWFVAEKNTGLSPNGSYQSSRAAKVASQLLCSLFLLLFISAPAPAAANTQGEKPIYLYTSPLTAAYLKANGSSNNTALTLWRRYLRKACRCFEEITRVDLLGKLQPGLLILPSAEVLDDEERRAIRSFAAAGGSLLATALTGTRSSGGIAVGHGFVQDIFKMQVVGEFTRAKNENWFMMPSGDGPLTWAIPAQRRMYMGDAPQNMLRLASPNVAAIVMDWNREKDDAGPNGVISFNETDAYRGVFFGFPESAWGFAKPSELLAVLDGTVSWLQREPRLVKSAWPNANIAAHLMEMDTEDKYNSAVNFAADVESIGTRTTFYSTTAEAAKFPAMPKELIARGHEMAYHADVHVGFDKLPPAKQEERIQNMIGDMKKLIGPDAPRYAVGFRAPLESYDQTTEIMLRRNGITHHAADPSSTEDRLPFFSKSEPELGPEEALVVLPRTQFDDINYTALNFTPEQTLATLKYDLDLVVKGGAFGLFSVHSQNYHTDRLLPKVMPAYVKYVAAYKDRIWIPRADEIAAWWRQRERVSVTHINEARAVKAKGTQNLDKNTDQTLQGKDIALQVSVVAPGNVKGLTVFVMNPKAGVVPTVRASTASAPVARVKQVDVFRTALVFDQLDVGTFNYTIRYP